MVNYFVASVDIFGVCHHVLLVFLNVGYLE